MNRYEELGGNSRVWIFQANRRLSDVEKVAIETELADFAGHWESHGKAVKANLSVHHDLFLVFVADEEDDSFCGRAVDASVRLVKTMEAKYSVSLLDRNLMAFMNSRREVEGCKLSELGKLVEEGRLTGETKIFNNLVKSKKELEEAWLVPLSQSWQWQHTAVAAH